MKALAVLTVSASCLVFSSVALAAGGKFSKPTPALLEKGKTSYTTNCLMCHGEKGDGNGPAGAMMNPKPRNFIADKFKQGDKPDLVFKAVTAGLAGTAMPGFGHLSEEERWGMTHYLLTFRKK